MSVLNWDNLRLFLAVARHGKLTAAGRAVGLDHSTLTRRLSALEADLGARLVDRSPRGVVLTTAGQALLSYVERIDAEVLASAAEVGGADSDVAGTVRLSTPEAFGTFLVAPNAGALHQRHPALQLELTPESRSVSLSRREADLAIELTRPPKGRVAARKLTDYRLGLYGSSDYLARAEPLLQVSDIRRHPLVWYIDEFIDLPELRYIDEVADDAPTVFRSSSIAAQQNAVAGGLGLGLLHAFAAEQDPRLIRVLADDLEIRRSYWLVTHQDQQRLPRVRAVVDFLTDLVDAHRARF